MRLSGMFDDTVSLPPSRTSRESRSQEDDIAFGIGKWEQEETESDGDSLALDSPVGEDFEASTLRYTARQLKQQLGLSRSKYEHTLSRCEQSEAIFGEQLDVARATISALHDQISAMKEERMKQSQGEAQLRRRIGMQDDKIILLQRALSERSPLPLVPAAEAGEQTIRPHWPPQPAKPKALARFKSVDSYLLSAATASIRAPSPPTGPREHTSPRPVLCSKEDLDTADTAVNGMITVMRNRLFISKLKNRVVQSAHSLHSLRIHAPSATLQSCP